jgi:sec-independent protein translocase protein TatA
MGNPIESKNMGLDNPIHLAFLLVVLLLVFGAKRLPELGRSLGSGMRGFRDSLGAGGHDHVAAEAPPIAPAASVSTPPVISAVSDPGAPAA